MRDRVEKYRRRFDKHTNPSDHYRIGCIRLAELIFFPMGSWIRAVPVRNLIGTRLMPRR